jgi:hypothetical protein
MLSRGVADPSWHCLRLNGHSNTHTHSLSSLRLVQAAAHVGTRDPHQFTSYAQRWFVKLCLQRRPLPAKVLESGAGYTLSGTYQPSGHDQSL